MTRKKAEQNSEQFADEVTAKVKAAPAWFTHEQMAKAEREFQANGVTRRIALAVLTKSGQELIDAVSADRDFAVAMADWSAGGDGYLAGLEAERKTVEHAQARVLIALAHREDMDEVLSEARSTTSAPAIPPA